jgi:hypothetical protein
MNLWDYEQRNPSWREHMKKRAEHEALRRKAIAATVSPSRISRAYDKVIEKIVGYAKSAPGPCFNE